LLIRLRAEIVNLFSFKIIYIFRFFDFLSGFQEATSGGTAAQFAIAGAVSGHEFGYFKFSR
jgi:hypothetical protein